MPKLVKALEREDLRGLSLAILTEIGPKAKSAQTAIAPHTKDINAHVRAQAVAAQSAVAGDDPQVLAATIAALDDVHPEVRHAAADSLGRLGAAAKSAEPALAKHAEDPDTAVRAAVAQARKAVAQ